MKYLNLLFPLLGKLYNILSQIFSSETRPTRDKLILLILSFLAMDCCSSVRKCWTSFLWHAAGSRLKSYYHLFSKARTNTSVWMKNLTRLALSVTPGPLKKVPVLLLVDDTVVPKFGKKFEDVGMIYDHSGKAGANYLNGHCLVCLMMAVPIQKPSGPGYMYLPLRYLMWQKDGPSKLDIAATLLKEVMTVIGSDRDVILCCDSWYPKGPVCRLVDEYENLDLVANVQSRTRMYHILSGDTPRKRGRPARHGKRVKAEVIPLKTVKGSR